MRLPDFLIVGAMRCGTSSLSRYLSEHPGVYIAPGKELHFFDLNERFELGLDWYSDHFTQAPSWTQAGEATQTYMYLPHALDRIAEALPGRRAIALLRDPVDRAYSHYWHNVERGREVLSFVDAVRAEPARLEDAGVQNRLYFSYLDRGHYLHQLLHVERVFGENNLLVILFEELIRDTRRQFAKVCSFLNVDDAFVPPGIGKQVNPYIRIRSPRLRRWAKSFPKGLQDVIGRMNSKVGAYPPLDPTTRAELQEGYRADVDGLTRWPDLDLSLWPTAT